jgi:hypothetical protein
MNWNDWDMIWKRQEPPVGANAEVGELARCFEAKRRKLARGLFVRDVAEGATGIFLSAFMAYLWWKLGRDAWPMAIAIALTLSLSAFFCNERIRAHRLRLGPDATMIAKLEAEIAELRHQHRLLFNVGKWYLAPVGAIWATMLVTVIRHAKIHDRFGPTFADLMGNPATAGFIILYFVIIVPLSFWGIWIVNRRAVRKRIEPRIEELEKLKRELLMSD